MRAIECIYRKMPGWRTSTQGITEIGQIAESSPRVPDVSSRRKPERRVGMISTGPGREQTIFVDEFAAETEDA